MSKKLKLLSIVFVLILAFTACTSNTGDANLPAEDNNEGTETAEYPIEIQGVEGGTEMIDAEEIKAMEAQTLATTNISSSGEVVEIEIKGIKINKILKQYDLRQDDFESIRFYAGDGYSIVIPKEILDTKDVMLYWESDGEPLDEKFQPLRVAVPDERSMYWVGNLAGMELMKGEEAGEMDKDSEDKDAMAHKKSTVIFMEAAISTLESEEYTYYENSDQAVNTMDLLSAFGRTGIESDIPVSDLFMEAVDDFTKTETMDIFLTGYIKYTGENAPMFLSPDLPKGMHVKNLLKIENTGTVFISESQSFAKYADSLVTILEDECVPLSKIEELTGLAEGMSYTLTAADGYSKTIDRETFLKGGIYARNNGGYGISFQGMDKKAKVKDILSIEVVEMDKDMGEEAGDDAGAMMEDYVLALKVNGEDFTTEGIGIEFVTVTVEKMDKEGNLKPAEWSGYRVSDILAANGIEEGFTKLTVTASDGFAIDIDSETANAETTIFGFVQDGESIGDEAPRLTVNGEGSNMWIRAIAEIAAE